MTANATAAGRPPKVIVIGAGVGGLSPAVALQRAGIPVSVFERRSDPSSIASGGGFILWNDALRHLLALEVLQTTLGPPPVREQAVELLQLSADTSNSFDQRAQARAKLTCLHFGQFGAFYKRSWRANDWLWGRLDGAERLAQVLLEPLRVRQLELDPEALVAPSRSASCLRPRRGSAAAPRHSA